VIDQVRDARKHGVRPRICGCTACSGPLRDEIAKQTRARRDLTLIWGIARKTAVHLEDLGVGTFDELAAHDPFELASRLRERKVFVCGETVKRWSEHARSYRDGRAVIFGPPLEVGDAFIALDLEYDTIGASGTSVWLVGAMACLGDYREHDYFWVDNGVEEQEALLALELVCATYPDIPVVTWAGTGADLSRLGDAAARHGIQHIFEEIERRHVDLFQHAARTMRIPHPKLSLKAVGDYFGIPRVSSITGGLEAGFLYMRYRSSKEPAERERLQADLVAYNRDDLEATAAMVDVLSNTLRHA